MSIPELAEGHQCYPIVDPANVVAGSNATLQIQYTSDWEDDGIKETYYACADVTYIATSDFKFQVPCFNATSDDFDISEPSSSPSSSAAQSTATKAPANPESKGLSGGAIAGIIIGVVLGIGFFVGGALYSWRRAQQQKRLKASESSVRNVKWNDDESRRSGISNDVELTTVRP